MSVGLNEHGCWIVDQKSGFHDVAVVVDYLLGFELEDVPASADTLEFSKIVDSSVSELEVV